MFFRLYMGIAISIVLIVGFTFSVGENYLYKTNAEAFLRDAHLYLEKYSFTSQSATGLYNDLQQQRKIHSYTVELELLSQWDGSPPCKDCTEVSRIDGSSIYESEQYYTSVMTIPGSGEHLVFSKDKNYFAYTTPWFQTTSVLFLLSLVCGIIPIFIFAIYLPTRQLQHQSQEFLATQTLFGDGNFSKRADSDVPNPVGSVAKNFNRMADEIESRLVQSQVFAQAIPHEVRTPLSRIQLVSDLIRMKNPSIDPKLLDDIDMYIEDINTLTEDIIKLSRLTSKESSFYEARKTELELVSFVGTRLNALPHGIIAVECDFVDEAAIICDHTMARLVVDNLIKNALKYAHNKVLVSIQKQGCEIRMSVEDNGPGIPPERRDEIFVPFSRLDKSRTSQTGGFGLGLAITDAAAKRSGWHIEVGESRYSGAQFTFLIPCRNERSDAPQVPVATGC
ncbi:HAMP domain-containing histidine kinase [Vibrio fortis]|uniref:histidine kinase n=1 Tax=Vibrio fortis TaxID=212667 RepID=A0A5N3S3V9_9VIBR|nr:HAMP domain-containing sensor histidine kinase [Vibrio fortis]KAB0301518.1 HAMP domain-containing histidine kinase [Vibrio fortis]